MDITYERNVQGTDSCLQDGDHTALMDITSHCLLSSSQEPSKCLLRIETLKKGELTLDLYYTYMV